MTFIKETIWQGLSVTARVMADLPQPLHALLCLIIAYEARVYIANLQQFCVIT